jgi:hypothetical protein
MNKSEWVKEITIGLEEQTQTRGIRFGTATELSRVLGYKDQKSFKASFLQNINPVVGKKYSIKDFVDANYGIKLF